MDLYFNDKKVKDWDIKSYQMDNIEIKDKVIESCYGIDCIWCHEDCNPYEECTPRPIEPESKYHSADYNCNHCENTECEHWSEYNELHS